ncbi:hypothetical protein [Enterobacter asburiae]|uniref:hypothetical protein n=1 Tax=Enterobacter asburiae TaxID=61645 RepID=UPI003BF54520
MKNNTQPALKERIEKALEDFTKGRASMHVPPLDTDVDMVLAECSDRLSELEARCAELSAENAGLMKFCKDAAFDADYEAELGMERGGFTDALNDIKTPATDAFLAEVRAQGVKSLSNAVQSVISERQRQQSVEGWTPEHDDEHTEGEMAEAAACYAMFANNQGFSVPGLWPWAREWWKQSGQRRDLVKAGALILAEIERIDRQESAQ